MTEQFTRPPSLRAFLEAGCDLEAIPDLEQYARFIVIGQIMPWQDRAKLALTYDLAAEAWLRGEEARPFGNEGPHEGTPELVRHYLWLAEGLMEPEVAKMFHAALPEEIRSTCMRRIREIDEETTAKVEKAVGGLVEDDDFTPPDAT